MIGKFKIKTIVVVSFFIVVAITGQVIINLYIKSKEDYYLSVQTELLVSKYKTSYKYFKYMANDIRDMYQQNPKLIKLLKEVKQAKSKEKQDELRKKIYKLLFKNYKRLTKMGVSQVHFHLEDKTSFLRMYKPNSYGDDISYRKGIELISKLKKPLEGFEVCKYMHGLRFIYPLFDKKGKFLASVEISYSSDAVIQSLSDQFVIDSHVLISKNILNNTLLNSLENNYVKTWETKDYLIETYTHNKEPKKDVYNNIKSKELMFDIDKKLKLNKPFSITAEYNYQDFVLTFIPMKDVENKTAAYIVIYKESGYLSDLKMEKKYIEILFYTITFMLMIFTFYVIYNREVLKELALYDNLTKLPNRTLFMIELKTMMNIAQRNNSKVALMFVDLDGFKAVNDTYGHYTGDELLKYVAKTLQKNVRKADIVSRLGGDEFTIILTDIKSPQEAKKVGQKIVDTLKKTIVIDHKTINIGASIGIAIFPDDAKTLDELVSLADSVMYEVKKNGKNGVFLYNELQKKE
jgi:diguanylate cyclase (GGDEF)-like protein